MRTPEGRSMQVELDDIGKDGNFAVVSNSVLRSVPNQGLQGSAEQRCCSVPVTLRAPAPPQPRRSAAVQ